MIKVSDYVIKYLENIGVEYAFVLPGGMSMYLVDSLSRSKKIKTTYLLHEQACVMASESANILHNKLISVVITTAGPGILNAVTPIASAYVDSTPLLVIAGQCKTGDSMLGTGLRQKGVQEVDAVKILGPIVNYNVSIRSTDFIKNELEEAIFYLTSPNDGPVFIEIPLDIQGAFIKEPNLSCRKFFLNEGFSANIIWDVQRIKGVISKINNSKKPLILVGNGVRNYLNGFKELINYLQIPVLTTWKSMDFMDEEDSLYLGRPGSISSRYANMILQECDLLISIGARLDLPTVAYDYKNFAKNAKKIIVDFDQEELDKLEFSHHTTQKFWSCAGDFIFTLLKEKDEVFLKQKDLILWLDRCIYLKNKYSICLPEYENTTNYVNPYYFINILSELFNKNDIIVPSSSGSASEMVCQSFKVKEGQKVICANGLGSMGFALPHAIGAAVTSNRRVICIEGDGSFQMNIQELAYIGETNPNIVIFIFNNNGYASIRNTQNKFFEGNLAGCDKSSGLVLPEIERLAHAYKIDYCCIKKHVKSQLTCDYEDLVYDKKIGLKEQLESVLNNKNKKPIICEVMIDPDFQTQPKVVSTVNDKGEMVSGTLENMWPFLEEK